MQIFKEYDSSLPYPFGDLNHHLLCSSQALITLGLDFIKVAEVRSRYGDLINRNNGLTYAVFKSMVKDLSLQFKKQEGRFYVLLSLDEAEHLRGIMHGRQGIALLPSEIMTLSDLTSVALWVMGDHDVTLLGSSRGYAPSSPPQHSAMVNSYRFMNSDTYFNDRSLTDLLRIFEENSCEEREKWWTDVRACRRRRQIPLDATMPITTVFTTLSEYQFMDYKAVVSRIQYELQERGLLVFDAFRSFNSSNSGLLTCSELYGGIDYLGIPFSPEQVLIVSQYRERKSDRKKVFSFIQIGLMLQVYDLVRRLATEAEVIHL